MRKDYFNIIAKIAKTLSINYPIYRLLHLWPFQFPKSPFMAEEYMEKLRADSHSICLEHHNIPDHPNFDLQIIIPVYNAEQYIAQCIESALNQITEFNYYITIVNDGSTDNSLKIINQYSNHPNLEIISKINGGVGSARNLSLKHICAQYITFVDADDILPSNAVQDWLHTAFQYNADIVEGTVERFQNSKLIHYSIRPDSVGEQLILAGKAASRIYKSKCWENICFPASYWAEDNINWMLLYHLPHLKMATISPIIYLYRQTPNSQSLGIVTNPRRIDTYWGTKNCLKSAKQLQLNFDTYFLECFIRQSCLNMHRIAILGDAKLNKALFEATRNLIFQYFDNIHTNLQKERHLEMALRNNNYKEFYLYCLFLM